MPKCRNCLVIFEGPYRQKYCSIKCQFLFRLKKDRKDEECWEWQAAIGNHGYGAMNIKDVIHSTHRLSYQLFVGEIPNGLFVLHKCDNRKCVNPHHLFLGTNLDNIMDMKAKGRAAWASKKMPEEIRKKISETRRKSGWKPSIKQIEASIAARREKLNDPIWRAALIEKMSGPNNPNYGKKMSAEVREKLQPYWDAGGNARGVKRSEETKRKMSESIRAKLAYQKENGLGKWKKKEEPE